ncbi:outer membrane protein [Sphingomonas laterariae]|uniref:Outer membrane protein n=1 Tax=Edaphosphingomonas laterariae TaxID=861865 RepID=A0A239K961_9SPHN|nr:TolC family outer membrane protein [Sphingomonas laterariae]SNT14996.1 outer membrane protein [Sphingomonas laterariae]
MRIWLMCGAALAGATVASAGSAETLRDALIQTYRANPTLTGARAQQRAVDEGVPIAKADARPLVDSEAGFSQNWRGITPFNDNGRSVSGSATASYQIYSGGRVKNSIRAADTRVLAGRADLLATEGAIFTETVAAYMDVIRDTSIVELNQNQVKVLETNLQASRDRFEVGDLTRTDVAQSEARLSDARSRLTVAEGRLTSSRENYRRLVGALPGTLEPPPPLPDLPKTPDDAVRVALANNANLEASEESAKAAGYDVRTARAARLPTLTASSGISHTDYLGTLDNVTGSAAGLNPKDAFTDTFVGVRARLPLYQGGGPAARIRQAQAVEGQALERVVEVERLVIADARSAFASYLAALETIGSADEAVSANRLALEGTRAENTVGTRNVLDVLNAEQELLNSQVLLVTARRDAYVAGFALLNAMGQAEMRDLNLDGGALYDPVTNYKRVRNKAWDWAGDPAPTTQATRTVDAAMEPAPQAPVTPPTN